MTGSLDRLPHCVCAHDYQGQDTHCVCAHDYQGQDTSLCMTTRVRIPHCTCVHDSPGQHRHTHTHTHINCNVEPLLTPAWTGDHIGRWGREGIIHAYRVVQVRVIVMSMRVTNSHHLSTTHAPASTTTADPARGRWCVCAAIRTVR